MLFSRPQREKNEKKLFILPEKPGGFRRLLQKSDKADGSVHKSFCFSQ